MNSTTNNQLTVNENKNIRRSYKKIAEERLGETNLNSMGSLMYIIEYVDSSNVTVQFKNGYTTKSTYSNFVRGNVKNPYDISVYGVGYLGVGVYKAGTGVGGDHTKQYDYWNQMLGRCYSSKVQGRQPTYIGCTVCEEWHNYQNFAKWFDENYYEIEGERISLDKDLLSKNNKIYSPDTCCFLPQSINVLVIKRNSMKGSIKSLFKVQAEKYKEYISQAAYKALINIANAED